MVLLREACCTVPLVKVFCMLMFCYGYAVTVLFDSMSIIMSVVRDLLHQ